MARYFKWYDDPEVYIATLLVEMFRGIMSIAANGRSRRGRRRKMMVNDVARVYFNVPSLEPTFAEICEEDLEAVGEDMCGELVICMGFGQ